MDDPENTNSDPQTQIDRRDFLWLAGMGAGSLVATGCATVPAFQPAPQISNKARGSGAGHIVVIGAGVWGSWTAYHLRQRGAKVTHIDAYGAGNSRATSGDETRGIRSSYGDRTTGDQWTRWARAAIHRWKEFDDEWGKVFKTRFYMTTGDVIMRANIDDPFIKNTRGHWDKQGVKYETLDGDEARKRFPLIKADDIKIAIVEPDAGVARARASTQAVAAIAQKMGVNFILGRVKPGPIVNGKMQGVIMDDGTVITGDSYVFCCGPWLRKLFPELLMNRTNVSLGYVCYFGVPEGDTRFTYPNMMSYNFPGVTGWPVLPVDSRGFRVRGQLAAPLPPGATAPAGGQGGGGGGRQGGAGNAGAAATAAGAAGAAPAVRPPAPPPTPEQLAQQDPDRSSRWCNQDRVDGSRRFLQARFPILADMPLLETRACHYESSVNRDFIIDNVPETTNAWIAGMGQAEGFKFAPIVGEYIATRVLGDEGDPALKKAFKMPTDTYDTPPAAATTPSRPPGIEEEEL